MSRIKLGLLGCGQMGRTLARSIVSEDVAIHAIYDPDPDGIDAARQDLGNRFLVAESMESLLAIPALDWIMIASWNKFHAEQVIAAFAAGKNVFCQKPLGINFEECLAMKEAWQASKKEFIIGFNLRYSPHYRKIKALIDAGTIGDVISFEFNETLEFNHGGYIMGDWRRLQENAGTHLLEKCCHDIDVANWIIGSHASQVASFGGLNFFLPENSDAMVRVGKTRSGKQGYRTWNIGKSVDPFTSKKDIVDNQVSIIEYENGVRATFHMNSNAGIPERRLYICGTEGALRADVLRGTIETQRIAFGSVLEDHSTTSSGMHGGGDEILAQEMTETMLNGGSVSTSFEDGLLAAVTCFAIDKAMETRTVVDLESYWRKLN